MVYLSTFVAVCGSFAFGSCVSEFTYPWKVLTSFVRPLIFFFIKLKIRQLILFLTKSNSVILKMGFDAGWILLTCSGCN